ncbi:hypothetical protein [Enterovibrio paralichthyis]|uniref:hypothetical protein n=1 Tax=Enterovibrio paralichthyis TaxID=2853805 RepID=UPI001C4562CE|nr:hypothetical protein [Enterovibrio paralichthyis]MBV7298255.1 hypothetical protein [Enterovibrio paralichthyis]
MNRKVIINGKEITNPIVIMAIQAGALIIAALAIAFFFFVVLPLIGIFIGSVFIAVITLLVVIALLVILGVYGSVIMAYLSSLFSGRRQ